MSRSHRNALPVGYRLHWYVIERILGQGGFGITYLARDTNLHQHVAVKEYLPIELAVRERDDSVHPVSEGHVESYRWGLGRFLDEARTLARFDHPNIVRVLSVFEHNNTAYMVMRYEQGRSLQEMLPRGATLDEAQLRAILFPVLEGLAKVHEQGFIHRDIKPGNLFVRADGAPVLLDFGSARQALGRETRTLTTLVSPGFAPFEQYHTRSDRQGPWTDIYALGATLYRAVTGRAPTDAVERSEGLLTGDADPLPPASREAGEGYSQGFLAAIDAALAFRDGDRPRSIDEWRRAFGQADRGAAETGAPDPEAETVRSDLAEAETARATEAGPQEPAVPGGDEAQREALYRAFVGPRRTDRWLARFADFDARGRAWPLSWSWPAALLTLPWLAWRRLYRWMPVYPLAVFVAVLAIALPISIVGYGGGDVPERAGALILVLAAVAVPGLLGNALYWRRARAVARRALEHTADAAKRPEQVARRGGTSAVAAGFSVLLVMLLLAGIGADRQRATSAGETPTAGKPAPDPAASANAAVDTQLAQAREAFQRGDLGTATRAVERARALALDPQNRELKRLERRWKTLQ